MYTNPFPKVSQNGGALTPSELNDVYSFGQFWIPAGATTPSTETSPAPVIETYLSTTGGTRQEYTVAKFDGATQSSVCFEWGFKSDFVAVPSASMLFKASPLWFSKTAGDGVEDVDIEIYANNILMGGDVNDNMGAGSQVTKVVPTTAFELTGGTTANVQASIAKTIEGSVLSATDWNLIRIGVERHANTDTFGDDVFLIGVGIQFAVDFNNVGVWPT
jgi:hypothetical protein